MAGSDKTSYIAVTTDPESEVPVYRHVAAQIRELIAHGELPAGYRLPSIRMLAADLGVSLNTVARAYRVLEEESFVVIRGRSRVQVAPPLKTPAEGAHAAPAVLLRALREALARLRQTGITRERLRELVEREIEAMPEASAVSAEADCGV